MDAVARYCSASERGDMTTLLDAFADDPEVVSPISGRMVFRGTDDVRVVLTAVHRVLDDLRWTERLGSGARRVALGEARVLGVRMTDAMVFELAEDGRIQSIRPHLRPWLALSIFAALLGPRVAAHPGVLRRALAG